MKKCSKCGENKEDCLFNKSRASKDGLSAYCKQCNKEYYNKYKKDNPEKIKKLSKDYYNLNKDRYRHNNYLRDFGITLDDYNRQLELQDHKCAICGETGNKALAVDHCHATGKVRGLLCWRCNATLGKFEDKLELFLAAITYLQNPPYEDKDGR